MAAAELVNDICNDIGKRLGALPFALVIWVKGEPHLKEGVAFATHPDNLPEAPTASRMAALCFEEASRNRSDLMRELEVPDPATFQQRAAAWVLECFGPDGTKNILHRCYRFLEEALELVQSLGMSRVEAHQLVDYVFGREKGDPWQEAGGTSMTLAALCTAADIDMAKASEMELARVWTKVEAIRAKEATKPKTGPLPGVAP